MVLTHVIMAPQSKEGRLLNTSNTIRRLVNKLKSSKGKVKENELKEDLVVDALPDYVQNKTSEQSTCNLEDSDFKNIVNEAEKGNCEEKCDSDKAEDDTYSQLGDKKEEKESKSQRKRQQKSGQNNTTIVNQTNVNVKGGGTFQIGNIYHYVANTTYNMAKTEIPTKQTKRFEKTKKIEELLECKKQLKPNHMEYLSTHFGYDCKEIGLKLDLTTGHINTIEHNCNKDPKKMSFEILMKWYQMNGEKATIGNLCEKLWESEISTAREAVQMLSEHIKKFKN